MSRYTHLLIATPPTFRPDAATVARFLERAADDGFLALPPEHAFFDHDRTVNTLRISRAKKGEAIQLPRPTRIALASASDFPKTAGTVKRYDAVASGFGRPRNPPLELGWLSPTGEWQPYGEDYELAIACCVREGPVLLGTESGPAPAAPRPGKFHGPRGEIVTVPDAGSASFWIEVRCGDRILPRSKADSLALATPRFVDAVEEVFGTDFVEGGA